MIRALVRNAEEKDDDYLLYEFYRVMSEEWMQKVFKQGNNDSPLKFGSNMITEALNERLFDKESRISKTMTGFFKFIEAEDEMAKPDSYQKLRNKK